ncbi:coiled-coil and C2 domain-containing protein 1A [Thamnophis elegans]|uniref:coiled-coil and C2 domain-containing protein 1A n=1 Tax=Thamnophis elegans TaxID=35005 RepID=UPI001377BC87|nr:coiled-coil and C2 domain-containing protein 1A [Thamnophis elegans]
MKKNRKPPPPPGGKGTAAARQMGLLLDFSPENMMASNEQDDHELEAELLAIVGGQPDPKQKPNGKTPLPMEAIEKMAALCMKDLDEEDGVEEEDLEDDDELMAELTEVLEEDDRIPDAVVPIATKEHSAPAASGTSESILLERLAMYKVAIANAKQAGESSKMRRYERGLKTLENLLTSVRKGKKIDEDEIPPPVATGKSSNCPQAASSKTTPASQPSTPEESEVLTNVFAPESPATAPEHPPSKSSPGRSQLPPKIPPPKLPKPKISPTTGPPLNSSETPLETSAPTASSLSPDAPNSSTQTALQARIREYKLAALRSKQEGDIEMATKYYRLAKSFEPILESLDKGEPVDLSNLPPAPDQLPKEMLSSPVQHTPVATATPLAQAVSHPAQGVSRTAEQPAPPRDMMEALQQRMDRYKAAAAQAKSKGEDRKARMHERIVKQYQEAIKSHKAGKPVEFADLPVPPGFPPIQGMESLPGDQSLGGILETAMKLANEDEDAEETKKPDSSLASSKLAPSVQPKLPHQPGPQAALAKPAPTAKSAPKNIGKAQQQLTFLENRRKQLKQAALRAKQRNDIEGAKLLLCQAKGLDPMIEASQSGLPVDISKVPPAPVNKEEFMLVQRGGGNISPATTAQYTELVKLMRQQHEMCISYSKQFTHLGNITETVKFEKMAEDCKKNMEILKQAHAKGFPLPKYHYEQRTFSMIKIFPELNSNDMILSIVKGINLPAPPGISPDDLDAFVRFEFPYPNVEEAQKDKTSVIKNSNCPEFQEKFKLYINRSHRGFKRAIQSKGIKFEVVHKGGLFKNDRVVGTAQLKLEALEAKCELREILELLDGRRPTGGRLEVIVRLREPLTSQQLETTTEKWLVIDPLTGPPAAFSKSKPAVAPVKDAGSSKPAYSLQSFSILTSDKERLEKKIAMYNQAGQPPPRDLVEQHQSIIQKINWQKSQLQHGGAAIMKEYLAQLEQYLQWYTEAARRLGNDGKREAAKDALYKRNLVERELQKFRK